MFERPSLLLSLCPQESQVFALLVSQSAATRPPLAMAGYESAFQAIDETIADCCLRELPWEFSANIWRVDPTTNARCVIKIILFIVLPFSPHFLPTLKQFPFQNSRLASVSTKHLFYLLSPAEGMHCIFLGWLSLSETEEKEPASFCKVFISLMQNASQIRRLADNSFHQFHS